MAVTFKNTLLKNTSVTPWSPTIAPNLLVWYDLNDASTVTVDGGNLVSQVNNKANPGTYDATQSSEALKPTYTTYNGLPCLQCDEDVMSMGTLPAFTSTSTYTLIMVCRYNDIGVSPTMHPIGNSNKALYKPSNASVLRTIHNAALTTHAQTITTNPLIQTDRWDGSLIDTYLNGSLDTNTTTVSTTITSQVWYLCAQQSSGVSGIKGEIFEVLLYNGKLKDNELSAAHAYLTNKWSIS